MADMLPADWPDDWPDDWDDNPDWTTVETAQLDPSGMLQVARASLGLTQVGAAVLLGIPVATLRNWEQRRTQPDEAARTLIRLLFRYPNEVQALLQGIDGRPSAP